MNDFCPLYVGASSGIGKHAALYLNERGFLVFATVRKAEDGTHVKSEAKYQDALVPVIMDITKEKEITAAAAFVRFVALFVH